MICREEEVPLFDDDDSSPMRLIFARNQIEDFLTLRNYGIHQESTIYAPLPADATTEMEIDWRAIEKYRHIVIENTVACFIVDFDAWFVLRPIVDFWCI